MSFRKRICRSLVLAALFCAVASLAQGGVVSPAGPETDAVVFSNVRLIPMDRPAPDGLWTVVVRGRRIEALGPAGQVAVPEGARIIPGRGNYLLPGLCDMHIHTRIDWLGDRWPVSPMKLFLANGVTTVHCLGPKGKHPGYVLNWRKLLERGDLEGPALLSSGPILYGPLPDPEKTVARQKAAGYDCIKLYSYLSPDEFQRAVKAAKEAGLHTVGHIPFSVGLDGALKAGLGEIAHVEELAWEGVDFDRDRNLSPREWMTYVLQETVRQLEPVSGQDVGAAAKKHQGLIDGLAERVKQAGVPVCTTLFLDEIIVQKLHHLEEFLARPEMNYMPADYRRCLEEGREKHQVQFRGHEDFAYFKREIDRLLLRALHEKGVPLVLGTDAGGGGMGLTPGFSVHDELELLVANGLTPFEAIATATVEADRVAALMGKGGFGSIGPGQRADLLLVRGNPLEDVSRLRDLEGVMSGGRWYDAADLAEMKKIAPTP